MDINLKRDATAAVVIAGFGACTSIYSYLHYPAGTINRMGPGMFPMILGVVLLVMGILLFAKSMMVDGQTITIDVREALVILASLTLFGLLVGPFGIIPAIAALVAVSTAAVRPFSVRRAAALAGSVTVVIVLIFDVAMRLHIPLVRWPF